jgi:pyruvate kinase
VVDASREQEITAIVTPSARGTTPMRISRLRPDKPILMLTENPKVANRFALIWGVTPVFIKMPTDLADIFKLAGELTRKRGLAAGGDRVIVTAGFPIYGTPTNLIYIHKLEREA